MANPRKFSEKIALHNQKQAEETAAFEEIMREVMGATRNRVCLTGSLPATHMCVVFVLYLEPDDANMRRFCIYIRSNMLGFCIHI